MLRHVTQKKNKIMSNEWITINLIKYDNTAVTWQSSLKAALTINCWTMPPLIRRWGRRNEVYSNHGVALKNVNSHFPMTAISMPTFSFSLKTNCYGQKYSVSFLVFISVFQQLLLYPTVLKLRSRWSTCLNLSHSTNEQNVKLQTYSLAYLFLIHILCKISSIIS